jgi:hypothetical protein
MDFEKVTYEVEIGARWRDRVKLIVEPAYEGGVIGADVQRVVLAKARHYYKMLCAKTPVLPIKGVDTRGDPVKIRVYQFSGRNRVPICHMAPDTGSTDESGV